MNNCYYHQDLRWKRFRTGHHRVHLPKLDVNTSINTSASVTQYSAIHFWGYSIRQVSYYTLIIGFRLPWPPPRCIYGATPFMVSDGHALRHLIICLGSSPIANYAYQNGPTWMVSIARIINLCNIGTYTFKVWELVGCIIRPSPLIIRFTLYT